MYRYLVLACTLLFATALYGQEPAAADTAAPKPWTLSHKLTVTFNQSAFSENWQAGGVDALGLGAVYNGKYDYKQGDWEWLNELIFEYGIQRNEGQGSRKTLDRIFYDTKVAYRFSTDWLFYGSLNFLSQFDAGFAFGTDAGGQETRTLISRYFAPAFVTESFGLEYKPVDYFWARFGAGTVRQTLVLADGVYNGAPIVFGVPFGEDIRWEVGFQLTSEFDRAIAENVNLKARFNAFANYETIEAVDTRLDLALTAKVNKWLGVGVVAVGLHDNDQDPDVQWSQNLLITFSLIDTAQK